MGEGKEGDKKELMYTALEWAGLFTCRYSCAASTPVTPENIFIPLRPIKLSLDLLLGYQ